MQFRLKRRDGRFGCFDFGRLFGNQLASVGQSFFNRLNPLQSFFQSLGRGDQFFGSELRFFRFCLFGLFPLGIQCGFGGGGGFRLSLGTFFRCLLDRFLELGEFSFGVLDARLRLILFDSERRDGSSSLFRCGTCRSDGRLGRHFASDRLIGNFLLLWNLLFQSVLSESPLRQSQNRSSEDQNVG